MAGVYKSLDASDIRLTPFRAYKRITSYETYSAVLNTDVLDNKEDIGNDSYYAYESIAFTSNDKSKNSVWHSIDSQFYRYYYTNPKASFGSILPNRHPRQLHKEALVISVPQKYYGEEIEPTSIELVVNGKTYVDDNYFNIVPVDRWENSSGVAYPISSSNIVYTLRATDYTKQYDNTLNYLQSELSVDPYPVKVTLNNVKITGSTYLAGLGSSTAFNYTEFFLNSSSYETSSVIIEPFGELNNDKFNFHQKDFAIVISTTLVRGNVEGSVILQKKQGVEYTKVNVEFGLDVPAVPVYRYPYKLSLRTDGKLVFEKSNGVSGEKLTYVSTGTYRSADTLNQQYSRDPVVLARSGSLYMLAFTNATGTQVYETFTDSLYNQEKYCVNKAPIHIGADENGNSGSFGYIGSATFIQQTLTPAAVQALQYYTSTRSSRFGYNNPHQTVGNLYREHGFIVITDKQLVKAIELNGITSLKCRGTTTIYETEISCTVAPGEMGFSNNPTLQVWDPSQDQYKLADYATGSAFRPFVTRIGLYDDLGRLLVIGSLSQPMQLPQNVDTTFIVKYDV
jgi:hypothetical protein